MNVSKTLSSAVAALAVVGGIGFAYAQTTTTDTTPMAPSQSIDQRDSTLSSPSTLPADNSVNTELAPQADRG